MLAGRSGSRLRPITHTSAKQLLPVANKLVLFYGLDGIREVGITEVGIVVEIESSILLRGSSVRGIPRIEASLIDHHVDVTPAPTAPRANRLVLGDHSKVQINS